MLRKIAFLHLNDVTPDAVVEVLHKKPNGMVVILPSAIRDVAAWKDLQHFFCIFPILTPDLDDESFPIPIYFAFETEQIMKVYEELKAKDSAAASSAAKCISSSGYEVGSIPDEDDGHDRG